MKARQYRVALFIPSFSGGGAERVFLTLAEGFLNCGVSVDFVVANDTGPLRDQLHPGIRLINLHRTRMLSCFKPLKEYLKEESPDVLITAMAHTSLVTLITKKIFGLSTPVILTEHSTMSLNATQSPNIIRERLVPVLARWLYPSAEKVVAVSQGVATDLEKILRLPPEKIQVIYNPINLEEITRKSKEDTGHPYFSTNGIPVIVSAGRLNHAKDFPTLIKAFASLREQMEARLIILGEGTERDNLVKLVSDMGLQSSISMPGFQPNPYSYFKNASVFALSSIYEGFSMVIIEALACGTAVVSTNCPSGPSEILNNDCYGMLVPPGSPLELAEALILQLQRTPDVEALKKRAQDFSVEKSIENYLEIVRSIKTKQVANR